MSITQASKSSLCLFPINHNSFLNLVFFLFGADILGCIVSYCFLPWIVSRKHDGRLEKLSMEDVSSEISKLPEILQASETFDNILPHLGVSFPCCVWPVSHINAADAILIPALLG